MALVTPARPSSGNLTRQSPQLRCLGTRSPPPERGLQRRASVASGCSPKPRRSNLLREVLCLEEALSDRHNSSSRPDRLRYLASPRNNNSSSSNNLQRLSLGSLLNSSRRVHLCLQTLQQQIRLDSRLAAHLEALSRNSLLIFLGARSHNSRPVSLGTRSHNSQPVSLEPRNRSNRQVICSEMSSHSSRVDCLGARLLSRQLLLAGWG